ncbi:Fe(3+)-hydroxamate ABC transporter permease FhuB [Rhizobium sp. LCM 4573]|uniref:Fe(3+)-hydroxamate ABC transporter permease FhuB n=1 Tax=Rhizobium sp. LCM 4573 TaxID=1848291 RepID=UPI0008DAFBDA|nr:Fe(3+)-hydroxamate ABC transporter permease FhuB [Rhizobium sp. LCM 4573]OHV76854.1 Fe3+-hydroxamate ABC transporter permease FhuB [Rhizobium sp. LCM 4573]
MPETVSLSASSRGTRTGVIPIVILTLACALSFALLLIYRPSVLGDPATAAALNDLLFWNSLLPRAAIALVSGAALGLAGALLQRVLRNPIADASTLGIASGAQLALTLGLSFSPLLIGASRELLAFGGGLAALLIVLVLSWRRGLDPVTVALSGMIISLIAGSLSVTTILARGEYAMSIHIWGAGSLSQQNWNGVLSLAPRLALGFAAALFLRRPLTVLALDDASAKSLGVALQTVRFAILLLAVWLSASVTATVGIIGFLGLAAPTLARLCGARTTSQVMLAAPLAGAAILFLADCLTQLFGSGFSDFVPTGVATALLGGPLLLFLLPRVHGFSAVTAEAGAGIRRLGAPGRMLILAVLLVVSLGVALVLGRGDSGWNIATGALLSDLLPFRLPRIVVAMGAGAMLGAAGLIMQRVTGNPLASPEVLGVSSGSGAGLTLALLLFGFPSPLLMIASMAFGALAAFVIIMGVAARSGLSAERLLLAGIAVAAFSMAIVSIVLAQGDMRGYILLTWLSGSTNRAGAFEAWTALISLAVLVTPLFLMTRWLSILPLGSGLSRSVGLRIMPSRLVLAVLAALMTAIASFLVGPLSLTGLIAPHLARLIGFHRPAHQLPATLLIGACVLVLADWLSRVVIYPYQVPVGLFAALIGGPYLLWLLTRRP